MTAVKTGVPFREMLSGKAFFYGAEVVTTRGISAPGQPSKLAEFGSALAADPRIGWVSVTDNPGGSPMLPPDWLSHLLASKQSEVVIHMTCKDLNRNALESAAWRYAAEGFKNVLALTGDYPTTGFGGLPAAVFDLDSVSLIALLHALNEGLELPGRKGKTDKLPKTEFFIGCGVSPFKRHERELMPQFFKLARKLRCGAQWVIPQLGYDMRKFQEVQLFLAWAKLPVVPLIGNVYVLSKPVAKLFNQNKIPGCVVSDKLLEQVEKYAAGPDKGKQFFVELAAKQLAVFKGLGFAAGYLAGTTNIATIDAIIDLAETYAGDDWKAFAKEIQFGQPDEFYLFEQDPATGLGDGRRLNRAYSESLLNPPKTANVTLGYRFTRQVHDKVFTPGQGQFPTLQKVYAKLEANKDGLASRALYGIEKVSKSIGFGCKDCGDCMLPDCAYLCPRASCSKASRNGPCGGSADGHCELQDKECLWARAYERLKFYGESEHMLDGPAVFYNATLRESSSWRSNFLGRDHRHAEVPADVKAAYEAPPPPPKPVKPRKTIPGLTIIGEAINDSVPSTKLLFDANDIEGLKALAKEQDEKGAVYVDVNVGSRTGEFLAEMVRQVQSVTTKPLSVDTPDPKMAALGLAAYDVARAGGKIPLLNSISQLREEMFELLKQYQFIPVLLVSERKTADGTAPNHTAEETYETAKALRAKAASYGVPNDHIVIDPAIAPIGSDTDNNLKRLMGALKYMHDDPDFKGVHCSVGLSNFSIQLPSKRASDGLAVKTVLECAFLTRAMPLGLDTIIGSVKRKYELLPEGHEALACFDEVLTLDGFDAIMRVRDFYKK